MRDEESQEAAQGVAEEVKPQHEVPYLHVRAPQRIVGVGGEGDRPTAKVYGNRAGLLALREQIDRALAAEEGMAAEGRFRETKKRDSTCG